jgi:hypothetical protein
MRAFAKQLRLFIALASLPAAAAAQGPASGLPPVSPETIVAAAQSCSAALATDHLDEQRLTGDRWVRSEMSDNGHPVDTPLRFFSRDSLLLTTMVGEATCAVLARIQSVRNFAAVRDGLNAAFGQPFRSENSGTTSWLLPGNRAAQLDPTGSRDRPSVRIFIIHTPENSQ